MQFDRTRIAVRERGFIDTLDLSLHVLRTFGPRLIGLFSVIMIPFALLNGLLTSWILDAQSIEEYVVFGDENAARYALTMRYIWLQIVLVFLEAPAAGWLATAYLGGAVFNRERTFRELVRDLFGVAPQLIWCQVILRGTCIAFLLPLFSERAELNPLTELLLPIGLLGLAGIMRAVRPFINEVIILERNPLRTKSAAEISLGQRSGYLHNPAGGDLFAQFLGASLTSVALTGAIFSSLTATFIVMSGESDYFGYVPAIVIFPLSMWITVSYFTVVRFLNYLDLRIRQEGWEVELLLRTETNRLQERLL